MELANKLIDDAGTILLGGAGELRVARGGGGTGVSKQCLDMAQAQAPFEQMRGEGMAQGVN